MRIAHRVAAAWNDQPSLSDLFKGYSSDDDVFNESFFRSSCDYYDDLARRSHNLLAPFEFETVFSASSFGKMCSFNSLMLSLGVSREIWAKELLDYFDSKVQGGLSEEELRVLVANKFLPVVERAIKDLAPDLMTRYVEDVKDLILKCDERSGALKYEHLGGSLLFAVALATKVPVIVLLEELKGRSGLVNLVRVELYGDFTSGATPLVFLNSGG